MSLFTICNLFYIKLVVNNYNELFYLQLKYYNKTLIVSYSGYLYFLTVFLQHLMTYFQTKTKKWCLKIKH